MRNHNILIIDDSSVDRMLMRKVLQADVTHIDVIENATGTDYMEQIKENDVKCIVLDLLLDDINGVDILKNLKEDEVTKDIPVIVCSSVGERHTVKETLALGAYDYFEKPFNDNDMQFGFQLKVCNAVNMRVASEKLAYARSHDKLTGFLTRHVFENTIDQMIRDRAFPLTLVIMDINGLKIINDAFGHERGDKVLQELSGIIKNLKFNLEAVARWGSDEFILAIKGVDDMNLLDTIQVIKDEIEYEKRFNFSVCFGWAIHNNGYIKAKYLIQKAEDHLHGNKILEAGSVRSNMIETMIQTLHQTEPNEEIHSQKVSVLCERIAEKMGFSEFELKKVRLAGLMHDVGKIAISHETLHKTTPLTESDWKEIKKHPELGFKILSTSTDTMEIANAVLAHHERYDGQGYPKGIRGEAIPMMARIISVADAFDAMTSYRVYKEAKSVQEAIEEVIKCSGGQFDPNVVEAFLEFINSDMDTYTRNIFFNTMI